MKKTITLLFALLGMFTYAQTFNPKTITLPKDVTVEDLSFLKEEIQDAQVVMLGEGSHFDGNMFEMKTKVIKYLYQEMGFKTMAFESGIYDVWKAQQEINAGENVKKAFKNSLHLVWSNANEFQSFVNFYDKEKSNLKLFGFDNQLTGGYSFKYLGSDLFDYCNKNNLGLKFNQNDFQLLVETMFTSYHFDEEDIKYEKFKNTLTSVLNKLENKPKNETQFYWTQIIKSLLIVAEDCYSKEEYSYKHMSARDKQMADNLLAYINKHPDEKIICWGADAHFANDVSSLGTTEVKDFLPMGTYIKKSLKSNVYSLATVTAEDSINVSYNKWERTPVDSTSFEGYLKKKGEPYLFISSNQPEMKITKLTRFFSPKTFLEARLDLLFDGYLYLNKSSKTSQLPSEENGDFIKSITPHKKEYILEKQDTSNFDNQNNIPVGTIILNEVLLYGNKSIKQIVKKVIDNLNKNYPNTDISSKMYTNITANIQNVNCLNLDFTVSQYEKGYLDTFTAVKQIKEIRWNIKNDYEPQNMWEFYGLIKNNPVRYAAFLNPRKFEKFVFSLDGIKTYNNKDVYVISFTSPRDHLTYTNRLYFSDFSGTFYVNKDDYAVVKVIENWEVKKLKDFHVGKLHLTGDFTNYTQKEYNLERIETDFVKINDLYYISHSVIDIEGKIIDVENRKSLPFTTKINSYWNSFNIQSPEKIKIKDEEVMFNKVKYNKEFWDKFIYPEITK